MPTYEQIKQLAECVNEISEKYQLIHATFAIEKLLQDKLKEDIRKEMSELRERILNEDDKEAQLDLFNEATDLKTGKRSRVRIIVDYLPQIEDDSARLTRTPGNTFIIYLPKSMESIRSIDGNINFEKLGRLRKLMAHELGHIVLHSGILCEKEDIEDSCHEEEADTFANILIELRRKRNAEIYMDRHFELI